MGTLGTNGYIRNKWVHLNLNLSDFSMQRYMYERVATLKFGPLIFSAFLRDNKNYLSFMEQMSQLFHVKNPSENDTRTFCKTNIVKNKIIYLH